MPICKKIYPNCIWILPPDWHGLNIYSALLTKDYWNYGTDIIRVCVTAISTSTRKPDVNPKSNIQIRFGSKVMGSLNELLCHHSLSSTHLLLDELFPISLLSSPRKFLTILSMKMRMMTPIIPTPIYMLSIPMIPLNSLNFPKIIVVQFQYQSSRQRHRSWSVL